MPGLSEMSESPNQTLGKAAGIGAQLVFEDGERPSYPLSKVITTLGRNEANDILLDDPKVSSFHANILGRDDGYHLLDLKSRNGTEVNGVRISASPLKDGDLIAFGDIRLRFAARTTLAKTTVPLARLGQRIQTMAIQSPALRREAEEILEEVHRHQEFLRDLVDCASALAESRTVDRLRERITDLLTRKLECRSVIAGGARVEALVADAVAGSGALADHAGGAQGRFIKAYADAEGHGLGLAFDAGPGIGWVAFLADGLPVAAKDEAKDLLDVILLFSSVLWRNLTEIADLASQETARKVEAKGLESRDRIESLERKNRELDDHLKQMQNGLVFAEGGPMEKVQALSRKLASVDLPVLITGETGTGKTHIAQGIHHISSRGQKPFVVIDCSTLPANLIESELFGHEKGAFTGAMARKSGKVESADGGTLFLDEIGDLPLELQGKLLRFVQEGKFERLGGNDTVRVDVRIIAATHYDLAERVKAQKFRQDLYYRLHVLPLLMPSLRERAGDIPVLARHFIRKHFGQGDWSFSPDALAAIRAHAWPGNVRELENKLQRAWLFHSGKSISAADLGLDAPGAGAPASLSHGSIASGIPGVGEDGLPKTLEEAREAYESELLRQCLRHFKGNITKCAEHLQISRNTCKSMLRKYKLVQDDGED